MQTNTHDVVDKSYSEPTSPMVAMLRNRAGKLAYSDSDDWKIAEYIEHLEKKIALLEKVDMYLKTSAPDKTGHYFIAGKLGAVDDNLLPDELLICPAYGVSWVQVYKRTDRTA